MDFKALDLKVGIEIHQELDTKNKLFCSCPPKLNKGEPDFTFKRKLRPSQSELGEIDPAALFEFLKGKTIIYEGNHENTCLVEMDEEPPGPLDSEALDITLIFSLMTGAKPVDEVQVMRKTVVDGSNTGGFQRTSVIALGGSVKVDEKNYNLEQICIEEDAARKMAEEGDTITYRLDRLGIPLMEITTAPEIHSPKEAEQVAARIGSLLRATGKVKRGIGTIRQDVNVSIKGGGVIEIKGVQDLSILSTIVEYEAQRQESLLKISEELKKRNGTKKDISDEIFEVSEIFKETDSNILKRALKQGGVVLAVKLPKFNGLVGMELCPNRRLGTEMSDHAKFKGEVKGVFHTDELPGYKIKQKEVDKLKKQVNADDDDVVVIVADTYGKSVNALTAVLERARQSYDGIPVETRSANPDGTTRYTRPRPGAARMYPETDVQPIRITPERLESLKEDLPELPEKKLERFKEAYKLNEKLANQIIDSDYIHLFEKIVNKDISSTLVAVVLTEDLKKLERDQVQIENLSDNIIEQVFDAYAERLIVKESIPDILKWFSQNPENTVQEALTDLGLELMKKEEIQTLINSVILDNEKLIRDRGLRAIGPLMGMIMGKARGKADAQLVNLLLKDAIESKLNT